MLCFVIHEVSTKFTIPVGYFFYLQLLNNTFYKLSIKVLKLLTDIVIKVVTDNYSFNVALFKKNCGGRKHIYLNHPILKTLPLLLSFNYYQVIKSARNYFLDYDMSSASRIIWSLFLKSLYNLEKDMPVKPVIYLTKKHLYPTNFDKMNVFRRVQIFSPTVTAS